MAVEIIEGFDTFTIGQITRRYPSSVAVGQMSMTTGSSGSGQAVSCAYSASYSGPILPLTVRNAYYFGMDVYISGGTFYDNMVRILTAAGSTICAISPASGGIISTTFGNSTVPYYLLARWFNLQIYITISATAGILQVKVDGNPVISVSGINTGSTGIGQILLMSAMVSGNTIFDNFWAINTLGTHSNTWPTGVMNVQTLNPLTDGSYLNWIPNFGTTHYSQMDDTTADDDTTTVYDTDPGHRDSYGVSSLTGSVAQVHAVRAAVVVRKDAGNVVKTAEPFVLSGGAIYDGPQVNTTTSYQSGSVTVRDDPNTSAQWTTSAINAMQIGVKTQDLAQPVKLVQSAISARNATTLAYPGSVTAGNVLVVALGVGPGFTPNITDTLNNVWNLAVYNTSNGTAAIMYAVANASGATTITTHIAQFGSNDSQLIVAEFSGMTGVIDVVGSATAASYNVSPPTITLTKPGSVVVSCMIDANMTAPSTSTNEVMYQALTPVSSHLQMAACFTPMYNAVGSFQTSLNCGAVWPAGYVYLSAAFCVV